MRNREKYIDLLVYQNSPMSKSEQIEILEHLFDIFIQCNKDMLMLSDGCISVIRSRKQFETLAWMNLKINFPDFKIKSYNEESSKYRWNIKITDIFDTISVINSFSLLRYKSNLFSPKQYIIKDDAISTITVIGNKLHIRTVEDKGINQNEYSEIVEDYKKHFEYFDELLKLIVDMRFAKNRKASFLYLRVMSNWGKSFFSGLLKNLEIAFEVDYHNLMNRSANDIAPIEVRNSFIMILDEFNNFSQEMKKLSHSFAFAPKFGMREEVELYLKILMSSEKSPSFSGGVDEQIINRVMVMDIADNRAMRLTDRLVYQKYGNAKYMVITNQPFDKKEQITI